MEKLSSEILEIKFSGGDITPEKVLLSELSSNIHLLEKLLRPILEQQNPDETFDKSFIGLHELGNKSISLKYLLKAHKEKILIAFAMLIECISANTIEGLPIKTIDELESISKFNTKYSCKTELGESFGDTFKTYVNFSDEFVSEKTIQVKGNTTVYGKIQWIGGDKPTITLLLTNGEKIDVSVKESDAKAWAAYSNVGVVGEAVWRGKELKLSKLIAKEIFPFDRLSPNDGFIRLKTLFAEYALPSDNI
jgi:hypothetical protein